MCEEKRQKRGRDRSTLSSAAAPPRCPAFTRCCSQLLRQRCSAALSVSNAPFKIVPLFLTMRGGLTMRQARAGHSGAEYILNGYSFENTHCFWT